jgi:uncharacterized protein YdaU (DUF1376 family)
MSSAPFMPLWVSDFTAKTSDLDAKETGAYLLILMTLWTRGGTLPADQKKLQRVARVGRDWPKVWSAISHYFTVENGLLSQDRLTEELHKVHTKREANAHAGARGGRAKALKAKEQGLANATISPKQPEPEPELVELSSARASPADFRERCFRAAGLDPKAAMAMPGLVSTIALERLIRDPNHPCDPDLDILPAIETCAAGLRKRGETLTNWSYCREAAIRNRDQRLSGNPSPALRTASPVSPAGRHQKHAGGGIAAAAMRVATQLREARGQHDDPVCDPDAPAGYGLDPVFSNHRRIAGASG